ncbi:M48 family metallopeptidase [Massilia sp. IC2-477]|uniref:M48 family metallopeptidase n=1 Tax=Massilia sp. IC2-477 TaxID=2887198 RepID=UPI001D12D8EB|nr:M48 family metallopeptidase [Massilia sp. IC2-477]MCC2956084.1 M48 family metallopeptidase [Massilia sp. IC2-477]
MSTAHYFDGRSARLHVVNLSTGDGAIHLRGETTRSYSLAGTRLAEPFEHAPTVLYFADGTHAELHDPAMRPVLAAALGYRKSWVVRWQEHTAAVLVALALLVALILSAWHWGIPAAAERLSTQVPPQADQALGRNALSLLERQGLLQPSRLSEDRIAAIGAILQRVQPAAPRIPLRLRVADAPRLGANALAFPDGTIVLTDEMVRLAMGKNNDLDAKAAAVLAGVLAHEVGHIEERHSVRAITRSSLTAALSATLFGDFSAVAAGLPAVLTNMEYSRAMELAADDYAARTLQARGIPTGPLADLFDYLDERREKIPKFFRQAMSYAATHPDGYARGRRLRESEAGDER